MKAHTSDFKNNVSLFGREIDSKITYELNGETIELGAEDLNSVSPHYEASILKSVMKELDIDSNVDIPLETQINYQFGVKVGEGYEYINFGNYIVYSSEKQEDLNSYKIKCYDKMLYAMKDYDEVAKIYPLSVRDYIYELCDTIGLTFKNANDTFTNYNRTIPTDLYKGLGYTYRDVLDELAQVTGSTICINEQDDELEIRYITDTNDTIDGEYLKDVNVNFGAKYGPVNSIVLSRGAESDNVYLQNTTSIEQNGLCEIKIKDNQIMNFNDRSDYLPDLLSRLDGLQYYINDFSSTGIAYYDVCDRYNVEIDGNTYSCVMFNDELVITQGLEENIHADMPEETETDYTKADKTDRKINQTYLLVDKQNQVIEGVVSQVSDQNEQIATIRLQYNELLSRISDIADITTSAEDTDAKVHLDNINASQPISIKIHPIAENICYLYPYSGLYPSSALFIKSRKLRFENTETEEIKDWVLPTDLWMVNSDTYDELELFYGDGTNSNVIVTRRCAIDANGNITALATPKTERYPYPDDVVLTDGDYDVYLVDNTTGYLYVQLMAKNIYTTQFYTKAETNTLIDQTATDITLGVNQTLSNYSTTTEMNSAIALKAGEINSVVATKVGENEVISKINQSSEAITINANKISLDGKTINLTSDDISIASTNFNVDSNGNVVANSLSSNNATITGGSIDLYNDPSASFYNDVIRIFGSGSYEYVSMGSNIMSFNNSGVWAQLRTYPQGQGLADGFDLVFGGTNSYASGGIGVSGISYTRSTEAVSDFYVRESDGTTYVRDGSYTSWHAVSLESLKKNFKKVENALDKVVNSDIYEYNFKTDKDKDKKHIGLVIPDEGGDFRTPQELISQDGKGIETYSMISLLWKAVQEQQEQIKDLKKEVNELKQEINELKGDK